MTHSVATNRSVDNCNKSAHTTMLQPHMAQTFCYVVTAPAADCGVWAWSDIAATWDSILYTLSFHSTRNSNILLL